VNWTNARPAVSGLYWFKGSREGKLHNRELVLSTVVEVTRVGDTDDVWFPRGESSVPISECDGWWAGPLEVPQ
jgi:hypothetical protein